MTFENFQQSIKHGISLEGITVYLLAMCHDGQGNWIKAGSMVDGLENATACWVDAYLNRKESDNWNADYWYCNANKKRSDVSRQQEWETIVEPLP